MVKEYKSILWGIIAFIVTYMVFVNIPDIYKMIPNTQYTQFLRVGDGYRKLDSILLTNFIYLLLLMVAILGLNQIAEVRKSRMMSSLSEFFKLIYDENSIKNKSKILSEVKDRFNQLGASTSCNSNKKEEKIRDFEKSITDFDKAAQIMSLYNNVGLLVERKHLDLEELPSIFPKNVIKYWEIFEPYIRLRRDVDRNFKVNGKTIKHDFYAEHFEGLYKKCLKYLDEKYGRVEQ